MSFKILGASVSPFVRKVQVFCAEKGLDYTLSQVSPFSPPEGWRDISPLGKIPVLDHDGRIINDSSIICAYLEKVAPEPALIPSEPYEMARALWFEEYADSGLMPVLGSKIFQPLCLRPLLSGQAADPQAVEDARKVFDEEVTPLYTYLDQQLGGGQYFVGGRLTIADISIASITVNGRLAGFPPDAARTPAFAAYIDRMHALPSFAACIETDKKVFGARFK